MQRPHYRRVSNVKPDSSFKPKGSFKPSSPKSDSGEKKRGFGERLVSQFIICGMLLAVILFVNLIDKSDRVGTFVKELISDQPTAENLKTAFGTAGQAIDSVITKFQAPMPDEFNLASDGSYTDGWIQSEESDGLPETVKNNFRIDEDVLFQIQSEMSGQ
jgi:hypothetical protein